MPEIILYDRHINRSSFNCGVPPLNNYIQKQVSQDIRKKLAVCYVLVDEKKNLLGYYTLSNLSISKDDIPEALRNKMRAYKQLPVTLLGRLAIDESQKGKGMGKYLLVDALAKSLQASEAVGSIAVVTDPKNEQAATFYEKFGFKKLDSGKMFITMKTIKAAFN